METKRLKLHGHEIAFRALGDGPVLVLLHGMAGSSATWRHVMPALARHFHVLAPDLLGHGESAKPRAEYSVSAHANVVRDLMAALGHDRATVVGQSFGGGVAMQFAYQFPARCERLVLVSSGGLGMEVSTLLRTLSLPGAEHVLAVFCTDALRGGSERLVEWFGRAGMQPGPVLDEIRRGWKSLADSAARQAFFRTLRAVIDRRGQTVCANDRLYLTAHVPTMIVWGARDSLIPVSHAVATHEAVPGSRLEIFEGAGHFPHCEAPQRFVETILDFVATTEPARLSEVDLSALLGAGASRATHFAAAAGPQP